MIVFEHVFKTYPGGIAAVRDLTLEVREGETLVLLGTSGSGKTTTLKMVNRLIEPSDGSIELDGRDVQQCDVTELRRSVGYVFQGIGLFPHMTVVQNVSIIPKLLGWPKAKRRQRSLELIELVGLEPGVHADRYPDELSGGQQQRVGVARALAADPAYLLMDEPFGALDAVTRDELQQELLSLKQRVQKTIVFVTHDIFEAITLADRIAVLHEGRLEQVGPAEEILRHPASRFVRNLFDKPAKQLSAYQELL